MANDTIFHYVQSYTDGEISRVAFWALARFKHPTHQISFHTARALTTLTFERSYVVHACTKPQRPVLHLRFGGTAGEVSVAA